nr:peptidoglycan-binding protein [Lactobacillus sp. ESL0230]
MKFKKILEVCSSAIMLATVPASMMLTTSTASAESTALPSISKNDIAPVANKDNQSLRQIAENNNLELSVVEQLNNNLDPDTPIPSGTPIYLPQNVENAADYSEGTVNDNTILDFGNDLLRSYGRNPVGNPYANVPASIKSKYYDNLSSANRSAKVWIAYNESTYSYTAVNGQYYGRFQLTKSYLNGDYSKVNQEKTADRYVKNRYGSWEKAKQFWQAHQWY